jgi:cysteine synthase A
MNFNKDVVEAIGNTPLIKLKHASELTGCTILGKAEFMNPGQSVKDRAGNGSSWKPRSAANSSPAASWSKARPATPASGLRLVASARGYRTVIVIPDTQSQEKKDTLRLCGAELIEVPVRPYSNPNNYQHVGKRLAEQLRNGDRAERRSVRRSVEQSRQPARPTTNRPGRRSGRKPAARSTGSFAQSAPAARWREPAAT